MCKGTSFGLQLTRGLQDKAAVLALSNYSATVGLRCFEANLSRVRREDDAISVQEQLWATLIDPANAAEYVHVRFLPWLICGLTAGQVRNALSFGQRAPADSRAAATSAGGAAGAPVPAASPQSATDVLSLTVHSIVRQSFMCSHTREQDEQIDGMHAPDLQSCIQILRQDCCRLPTGFLRVNRNLQQLRSDIKMIVHSERQFPYLLA